MTDPQRHLIFNALLGDVGMFAAKDPARIALEDSARGQLNAIEPIIDGFLEDLDIAGAMAVRNHLEK